MHSARRTGGKVFRFQTNAGIITGHSPARPAKSHGADPSTAHRKNRGGPHNRTHSLFLRLASRSTAQCAAALSGTRIVFDHEPHASRVNSVIVVAQEISESAEVGPRNSRTQFLSQFPKLSGRFADRFHAPFRRIARLRVFQKSVLTHSARKLLDKQDGF